jgi:16S rRNA (guanine(966)-N(2))-methyltransferase RsmD
MRIIAGTKKAMKLFSPKTDDSRPITDRIKESLFNVLYNYGLPEGSIVADLFSGVGSLGLEALSRGAQFTTFVEKDPKIIAILERNIERAGFVRNSKVVKANAFKIGAPVYQHKYDLVFVDPPYSTTSDAGENSPLSRLLVMLAEQLSPAGLVIVRTEKRVQLLEQYGRLQLMQSRRWGSMAISFLNQWQDDK